jgi:hypothetical protein
MCRHDRPRLQMHPQPEIPAEGFDPAAMMRELAARLIAACQADPGNAPLARELRMTLLAIDPPPGGPDEIDMLQLAEWQSRREDRG